MTGFYRQLKDRKVIRAGVVYLAVFWLVLQVADILTGSDLLSDVAVRWLILSGLVLFPLVLILSWYLEHPWHHRQSLSIAGDLALLAAITVAASLLAWQQWNQAFTRPVIAVLALEPTDTQPGTSEMSAHLGRQLRMLLATSREVRVIETSSAWHDSLEALPMSEKAAKLNADYLLSGTINQTRLNIRITLQLFDSTGALLWSERFRDRIIDQYHLQNSMIAALGAELKLPSSVLLRFSEILQSCEYPIERDLILVIAGTENELEQDVDWDQEQLQSLIGDLDNNMDGLNEAGLFHLLRGKARLMLIDHLGSQQRSVAQALARKDLEEAAILCPANPTVALEALLSTRALESSELEPKEIISTFPNSAELRARLSAAYAANEDHDSANTLACEAFDLDPLTENYFCSDYQLSSP